MTTEDEKTSPPPSTSAERMRLHRQRRRKGLRAVRFLLSPIEIEALVRRGYLGDQRRSDPAALQLAAEAFISDSFFDALHT